MRECRGLLGTRFPNIYNIHKIMKKINKKNKKNGIHLRKNKKVDFALLDSFHKINNLLEKVKNESNSTRNK